MAKESESHSVPGTYYTQATSQCSVKQRTTATISFVDFKVILQLIGLTLKTSLFKVLLNVKFSWRRVVTLTKWWCIVQSRTSLTSYSYYRWMSESLVSNMPTRSSRVKGNVNSDSSKLSLMVEITPLVPVAYVNVSMIVSPIKEVNNE